MNNSPIPENTIKAAAAWLKKWKDSGFGIVETVPAYAPEGITTGKGYFKSGLRVWIVGGNERTVFLGPNEAMQETKIPEFTVLTERGEQRLCQYGRDFVFAA
jgi:hypothetical protein